MKGSKDIIKIILTDDHKIVRDGIKALLKEEESFEIVGEASSGDELIELIQATPVDLVLLDVKMPKQDGIGAVHYITENFPEVKVLVLSMHEDEQVVQEVLSKGAKGYLLKSVGVEELCHAIHLVYSGVTYICSDITLHLLQKKAANKTAVGEDDQALDVLLSKRELEVLHLIADGYTNAEIAEKLFTSKRTVETHRQNLLEKTKSRNTASLIKYAVTKGIV